CFFDPGTKPICSAKRRTISTSVIWIRYARRPLAEIRLRTSEKMPNRKSRCRTSSMRCREELAYSSATHIVPFRERIRYDEPSPEKSARRKAATDPRRARKIADGTFFSTDRQAQP